MILDVTDPWVAQIRGSLGSVDLGISGPLFGAANPWIRWAHNKSATWLPRFGKHKANISSIEGNLRRLFAVLLDFVWFDLFFYGFYGF